MQSGRNLIITLRHLGKCGKPKIKPNMNQRIVGGKTIIYIFGLVFYIVKLDAWLPGAYHGCEIEGNLNQGHPNSYTYSASFRYQLNDLVDHNFCFDLGDVIQNVTSDTSQVRRMPGNGI